MTPFNHLNGISNTMAFVSINTTQIRRFHFNYYSISFIYRCPTMKMFKWILSNQFATHLNHFTFNKWKFGFSHCIHVHSIHSILLSCALLKRFQSTNQTFLYFLWWPMKIWCFFLLAVESVKFSTWPSFIWDEE